MWKSEVVDAHSLDVEPVGDTERFAAMVRGVGLVGIARSAPDGTCVTFLSDIAVDREFQRQGIDGDLMRVTQEAAPRAKVVLVSAPAAIGCYPRIGFTQHQSAWARDALS